MQGLFGFNHIVKGVPSAGIKDLGAFACLGKSQRYIVRGDSTQPAFFTEIEKTEFCVA